jgi:sulfur relay protein TusC/DsrF
MEKIVILIRGCPYGAVTNGEAFRTCIGLAACEMQVEAILMDDGVYAALKNQKPKKVGMPSLEQAYKGIESQFDVPLYVHAESLKERGIKETEIINSHRISTDGIKEKIKEARSVLSF